VITQQQLLKDIWGPTHTEDTHYLRIVVGHLRRSWGMTHGAAVHRDRGGVGYRLVAPAI
jgi:two-component system KDP operon response regulator KdpE